MKITMARLVTAGLAISAAGCASALITDVAQDKVRVTASDSDQKRIAFEAEKGCGLYNRQPVLLSKRCVAYIYYVCSESEYLFACKITSEFEPGSRSSD